MPVKIPNTFRPVSPIGQATANLINSYVGSQPTALEREKFIQQQNINAAPNDLAAVFAAAYGDPNARRAEVTNPNVTQEEIERAYPTMTREQVVQQQLPNLVRALGNAGEYGDIGATIRALVANAPGLQNEQMIDRSMLGAGNAYSSTIGGFREAEQGKMARKIAGMYARGTRPSGNAPQAPSGNTVPTGGTGYTPDDAQLGGEPPVVPVSRNTEDLYSLADDAAGVLPAMIATYNKVGGQVGLPIDSALEENRQTLRTAQNNLIRALTLNPKMPVAEIKRIKEELSISPDMFDSPPALQARMRSMDNSLRSLMRRIETGEIPDPTGQTLESVRVFLEDLNVPGSQPARSQPVELYREGQQNPGQAPASRPSLNDIFGY